MPREAAAGLGVADFAGDSTMSAPMVFGIKVHKFYYNFDS